jgi:hypothetical protein
MEVKMSRESSSTGRNFAVNFIASLVLLAILLSIVPVQTSLVVKIAGLIFGTLILAGLTTSDGREEREIEGLKDALVAYERNLHLMSANYLTLESRLRKRCQRLAKRVEQLESRSRKR